MNLPNIVRSQQKSLRILSGNDFVRLRCMRDKGRRNPLLAPEAQHGARILGLPASSKFHLPHLHIGFLQEPPPKGDIIQRLHGIRIQFHIFGRHPQCFGSLLRHKDIIRAVFAFLLPGKAGSIKFFLPQQAAHAIFQQQLLAMCADFRAPGQPLVFRAKAHAQQHGKDAFILPEGRKQFRSGTVLQHRPPLPAGYGVVPLLGQQPQPGQLHQIAEP